MKAPTSKTSNLFPADVQAEYDRFILERRKRDAKRRPIPMKPSRRGPDRSGY